MNQQTQKRLLGAVALAITAVIWQIIAEYIVGRSFILPSVTDVAGAFVNLLGSGTLFTDTMISLEHFGIGLIAALLLGVPIGILMGWFRVADFLLDPIIEILRPIPPLAWIPFAIIWFGLTTQAAGFVIFAGAFFPILTATYSAFRDVPKVFVEAGKVLGCDTSLELIRHVALPAAIPGIASGIRIAMGVGWMCLVAAEMFGVSSYGLGYQLWHNYYLHQMPNVVVYMLILGLAGLIIDRIFRNYVDKQLLRWRAGEVA
ncbi:ABC transporter permease [Methanoculleus horonobensis]|jgi:NitT/TauT family transport system permease protein|uniref:ABC transporter permease n=1 Tax=Methanoculleus horonobensis TaxID=528314 RepID=UPI00082E7157|nr:ABC transporter permease [Methanoculleus horonobensis]MDD3069980.1 ABC transporter permease [Methanoculleus horonobensis]MDD4253436.1 ABC transporter permease [Methanoculleus horonobensis]